MANTTPLWTWERRAQKAEAETERLREALEETYRDLTLAGRHASWADRCVAGRNRIAAALDREGG
jgi:hypothetical protein